MENSNETLFKDKELKYARGILLWIIIQISIIVFVMILPVPLSTISKTWETPMFALFGLSSTVFLVAIIFILIYKLKLLHIYTHFRKKHTMFALIVISFFAWILFELIVAISIIKCDKFEKSFENKEKSIN